MLQNIQDYVNSAPDGLSILSEQVKRRFPQDDTWVPWDDPRAFAYSSTSDFRSTNELALTPAAFALFDGAILGRVRQWTCRVAP